MTKSFDVYNFPSYYIPEAVLHLHTFQVPLTTIRSWVVGQPNFKPLIKIAQLSPPRLSFINLVELYVLASIRRKFKIPMPNVRTGLEYVKDKLKSKHPLAEYGFQTNGIDLFLEHSGILLNISKGGQLSLEFIKTYLNRIERNEAGLPRKLYPLTRLSEFEDENTPKFITINPNICFGRPILENISTPVETISERFWAGESFESLMKEYDISQEELQEVVRFGAAYLKAA